MVDGENCVVSARRHAEAGGEFQAINRQAHEQNNQLNNNNNNNNNNNITWWDQYLFEAFYICSLVTSKAEQIYYRDEYNGCIVDKKIQHVTLASRFKDYSSASSDSLLINHRPTCMGPSNSENPLKNTVKTTTYCNNDHEPSTKGQIIKVNTGEQKGACSTKCPPSSIFLLLLALLGFQNAQYCRGFDYTERLYDTGIVGYNNPYPTSVKPIVVNNFQWNQLSPRNFIRQLSGDPLGMMSTLMPDSFSSDQQVSSLNGWTDAFSSNRDSLDTHIKNILVPRVSGTLGATKVRQYIENSLRQNDYHVELDEFTGATPIGNVNFANIIADSNPGACRQLVLACHYDSKMTPEGFLGATDSAVPCAMLLKMAETFNKSFREVETTSRKESLGLRFIFFDGEEAFYQWSATDSLYGSRHLAEKWEYQAAPSECGLKNELSRIELFVLLDLIGASDTSFVMYNRRLKSQYNAMQRYEKSHLARSGLTSAQVNRNTAFKNRFVPLDYVEDDHIPFKRRGVPILSLLSNPFPKVWHTMDDNYSAIDFPRTRRILHVLEEFVANYTKDGGD